MRKQIEELTNANKLLMDEKTKLDKNLEDSNRQLMDNAYGSSDASERIKELLDKIKEQQEELEETK